MPPKRRRTQAAAPSLADAPIATADDVEAEAEAAEEPGGDALRGLGESHLNAAATGRTGKRGGKGSVTHEKRARKKTVATRRSEGVARTEAGDGGPSSKRTKTARDGREQGRVNGATQQQHDPATTIPTTDPADRQSLRARAQAQADGGSDAEDDIHTAPVTTGSVPRQEAPSDEALPLPPPLAVPATSQALRLRKWTQTIPARTVTGKWGKLSRSSQEAVQTLITNAKRVVVQSASAGVSSVGAGGNARTAAGRAAKRIEEADTVVGQVARSLARRVPVMVLPVRRRRRIAPTTSRRRTAGAGDSTGNSNGDDNDDGLAGLFDIEAMVHRIGRLEGELTTVLDAIKLADDEIEREKDQIRLSEQVVHDLTQNSRDMEREWARWEKQMPSFLHKPDRVEIPPDSALSYGVPTMSTADPYANLRRYISQLNDDDGHADPTTAQPAHQNGTAGTRSSSTTTTTTTTKTKTTVSDPAFSSLLAKLSDHLTSLDTNHEPVRGVSDAVIRAEVAVAGVVAHTARDRATVEVTASETASSEPGTGSVARRQIEARSEATMSRWVIDLLALRKNRPDGERWDG